MLRPLFFVISLSLVLVSQALYAQDQDERVAIQWMGSAGKDEVISVNIFRPTKEYSRGAKREQFSSTVVVRRAGIESFRTITERLWTYSLPEFKKSYKQVRGHRIYRLHLLPNSPRVFVLKLPSGMLIRVSIDKDLPSGLDLTLQEGNHGNWYVRAGRESAPHSFPIQQLVDPSHPYAQIIGPPNSDFSHCFAVVKMAKAALKK